ncbi:hypothetical protein IP84_13880 [beta proteobacterium AAP99]|nr:hypothetical protein IP84_13880 [beta proteobacterium AAP99]
MTLPALPNRLDVAMVAGEASGDLIASLAVAQLAAAGRRVGGIGGPRMAQAGFQVQVPMERLSVRGYVEVLRHLPGLLRLRADLARQWSAQRPGVFVGVDAPDFNLGLATKLRASGVRTVQLVCPSIWAWRRERAPKIRAAVDEVLCVFPFEPDVLAKEGIVGRFVGHPLADMLPATPDRAAARIRLGLPEHGAPIVALLPGSRRDEIKHLAPRMIAAAALIWQRIPEARFVLPAASGERRAELAQHLAQSEVVIQVLDGRAHDALEAADSVLVASGTATLEAALFHCPMVITYAMPALSYWMMKGKGYLPWVGLPNILCNEWVVPELIQDAATPQALAEAVIKQLTDTAHAAAIGQRFAGLHAQLRQGFPSQCTQAIERHLNAA